MRPQRTSTTQTTIDQTGNVDYDRETNPSNRPDTELNEVRHTRSGGIVELGWNVTNTATATPLDYEQGALFHLR